jgi:hypothetical protein
MTALAQDRQTEFKHVQRSKYLPAGTDILYNGAMVMVIRGTGYLVAAANTLGGIVLGVMAERVDNSGGSPGDESGELRAGIFKFANSGTNPITQAHVGMPCYVEDDQTVADEAGGGMVVAGIVEELDDDGDVWVAVGMDVGALQSLINTDELVTSGALSLLTRTSRISVTGTAAYTLAAGLYEGQRKSIIVDVAASTPDGTLTPAVFAQGTSIDLDAVNESCELEYHDADGWNLINIVGATVTP